MGNFNNKITNYTLSFLFLIQYTMSAILIIPLAIVAIIVLIEWSSDKEKPTIAVGEPNPNLKIDIKPLPPSTSTSTNINTSTSTNINTSTPITKTIVDDNAILANLSLVNTLASAPTTTGVQGTSSSLITQTQKIEEPTVNYSDLVTTLSTTPMLTPISTSPVLPTTGYKTINNMDYPSNDMAYIEGTSDQCATRCTNDSSCAGFVLDKVTNKNCWLKSKFGNGMVDNSKTAYYKGGRTYQYKAKWAYPGNDIRYVTGPFEACSVACDNTPDCVGYTLQLDNGSNCWLKRSLLQPGAATPTRDTYYL